MRLIIKITGTAELQQLPYSQKNVFTGGKNVMQSFIVEHYLKKVVDVYCGGPDIFKGTIEACADNVLTLKKDGKLTHIAIDKVIAIWEQ